jgi:hypothetical protein
MRYEEAQASTPLKDIMVGDEAAEQRHNLEAGYNNIFRVGTRHRVPK